MSTLICIHGYGVRAVFWRHAAPYLEEQFDTVVYHDMEEISWDDRVAALETRIRDTDGPVLLLGHSMGAVMAALLAQRLGSSEVSAVAMIAAPYGPRDTKGDALTRFLIRHRLIPPFMTRPLFYSRTPVERQKEDYRRVVPEPAPIQNLLFGEKHFHTDWFSRPLDQPALMLCSEADKIVSADESEAFARVLGAKLVRRKSEEGIGHNDFTAAPDVVPDTVAVIKKFFTGEA